MDKEIANRFFRMRRTVSQMIRDRGFNVDPIDYEMDFDTFLATFPGANTDQYNKIYEHNNPNIQPIMTKFDYDDGHFTNKQLKDCLATMKAKNINHAILIVTDGSMTPMTVKTVEKIKTQEGIQLELFEQKEVLINITEHELVPRHRPLADEEKKQLLDRYQISESQIPRILKTDPVIRYLGVDVGTVVEITRNSETADRYITYRLVC
ncbi:DNA-directed RNA polymerases II and IV subunit 5A [Histomonas meleagridis]|uniref:DNA-directed RNA polymerases II and IV subunit 5A n=1 Tax=Histomonas meleagridis TaxID=135588 RepID=UPI003559ECF4|nr:DNA-directed RNA polymerases II and IV subunit 5A [Histomonas meleagridis]KAH0804212.1 DNA-directed RNA polymerases II and IV subunit 5A [Histomonas meleagridis]